MREPVREYNKQIGNGITGKQANCSASTRHVNLHIKVEMKAN